jgi:hypothetical protein
VAIQLGGWASGFKLAVTLILFTKYYTGPRTWTAQDRDRRMPLMNREMNLRVPQILGNS